MELRIDDALLDPDQFIKTALEQRIEAINRQLAQSQPGSEEQKKLITARTRFAEALRPYRAGAHPQAAGVPAPTPSAAAPSQSAPLVSAAPPAAEKRMRFALPEGAVPRPRRFAEPPVQKKRPAPRKRAAPESGMVSFLKSVQSNAREQVIPSLASDSAPAGAESRRTGEEMPAQEPMQADRAAAPRPEPPRAAPIPPPQKGSMLSYLEKMRSSGGAAPPPYASSAPEPAPQQASESFDEIDEKPKPAEKKKAPSSELSSELKGLLDEIK